MYPPMANTHTIAMNPSALETSGRRSLNGMWNHIGIMREALKHLC